MMRTLYNKIEGAVHHYLRTKRLAALTGSSVKEVSKCISQIRDNRSFIGAVQDKMKNHLSYTPSKNDFLYTQNSGSIFFPCVTLYALIKLTDFKCIVETGGTPGKSTIFILEALKQKEGGHLYTLDLPPKQSKEKIEAEKAHSFRAPDLSSCWLLEESFYPHHTLILGNTKKTLLPLLKKLGSIDIFIHDSDHSYKHMTFEFKTSWEYLRPGGLLIADDVSTNSSFSDFARSVRKKVWMLGNYGLIVK